MKKIVCCLLSMLMILSLGTTLAFAEVDDTLLTSGDAALAAYLSVRENAEDHDMRILLVAKESVLLSMESVLVSLSFTTPGSIRKTSFALADGAEVYRSVIAAGKTYTAADGYVIFGIIVTDITYSGWQKLSVDVIGDGISSKFSLDYAKAIRKDTVNLLGHKNETEFPVESYPYAEADKTTYYYQNVSKLTNVTITSLRIPVASCEVGDIFTVKVTRWINNEILNNNQIGDAMGDTDLSVHMLVAKEAVTNGFVSFDGLSITVPHGCSLMFGDPSDDIATLYLPNGTPEIDDMYLCDANGFLPYDFYGYRSENFFSNELSEAGESYVYSLAPFIYADTDLFSNSVITSLDLPLRNTAVGSTFTVWVIKFDEATKMITEIYDTHTLCINQYVGWQWLNFDVHIEVPEGYTLAFGKDGDTAGVLFSMNNDPEYYFYSAGNAGYNTVTLAFRLYGYYCN